MGTASLLLLLTLQATAQDTACRHSRIDNQTLTRKLANGATITVQPLPPNELQQACGISVRDRSGKTIFEDRGFSTNVDAATGHDIDNDGHGMGLRLAGQTHFAAACALCIDLMSALCG